MLIVLFLVGLLHVVGRTFGGTHGRTRMQLGARLGKLIYNVGVPEDVGRMEYSLDAGMDSLWQLTRLDDDTLVGFEDMLTPSLLSESPSLDYSETSGSLDADDMMLINDVDTGEAHLQQPLEQPLSDEQVLALAVTDLLKPQAAPEYVHWQDHSARLGPPPVSFASQLREPILTPQHRPQQHIHPRQSPQQQQQQQQQQDMLCRQRKLDWRSFPRRQSISKMPLAQLYHIMGLSHDHSKARDREERIMRMLSELGFQIGQKTWIRDTEESYRRGVVDKIFAATKDEYGYNKHLLEAIIRRGTYARMQSNLRRRRRHMVRAARRRAGDSILAEV